MSLELAIQQNTAAIHALIETLSKGASLGTPAEISEEAPAPEKTKRNKKDAKLEAPAPEISAAEEVSSVGEPADTAESAGPPEAGAAASTPEKKQVSYTEASAAVVKLANTKGRQAAVEVLATFGAKTLGEVKASSYADVIAACEAAL